MTSGERAVWAAEFASRKSDGHPVLEAARLACISVQALRATSERETDLSLDHRAMLDDMLSNGGDR